MNDLDGWMDRWATLGQLLDEGALMKTFTYVSMVPDSQGFYGPEVHCSPNKCHRGVGTTAVV